MTITMWMTQGDWAWKVITHDGLFMTGTEVTLWSAYRQARKAYKRFNGINYSQYLRKST